MRICIYSFVILLWSHLGVLEDIASLGAFPRRGKTTVAVGANLRAGSDHKSLKKPGHPVFAYAGLKSKGGHAWSFLVSKKAEKERQACPRAYCTMPSISWVTGIGARSTLEKRSFSLLNRTRAACGVPVAVPARSPNAAPPGGDSWRLVLPSNG